MKSSRLISSPIELFYTASSETDRLKNGLGPFEYERTKELIQRYITAPSMTIADVGGGPGVYAEWLASLGHTVHLVDPVQKHIEQAAEKARKYKHSFTCSLGEAQELELENSSTDLVILHGPLYHLQSKTHRLKALLEAKRILKPGAVLLGFAINFTASTIPALINGWIQDEEFFSMCRTELSSGYHEPLEKAAGMLPEAYFHKPDELEAEVKEAGFKLLDIFPVEGCVWIDKNYFAARGNPEKWNKLSAILKITEKERSLLGFSPHIMIAAQKI